MRLVVCGWLGTRNATAHSTLLSVSIGQPRLGTLTLWQESIGWAGQRQGEGGLGTRYPSLCHYDTMTGWAGETLWHSDRRALAVGGRLTRIDAVCGDPEWRSQASPQNIFTSPYFTLFLPDPSSWVMGGMTSPHPAQSGYQCCSVPWPVELLTKVYTKTTRAFSW